MIFCVCVQYSKEELNQEFRCCRIECAAAFCCMLLFSCLNLNVVFCCCRMSDFLFFFLSLACLPACPLARFLAFLECIQCSVFIIFLSFYCVTNVKMCRRQVSFKFIKMYTYFVHKCLNILIIFLA